MMSLSDVYLLSVFVSPSESGDLGQWMIWNRVFFPYAPMSASVSLDFCPDAGMYQFINDFIFGIRFEKD